MKTFDLELKVTEFGAVLATEIFLEDSTDQSRRVTNFQPGSGHYYKKLPSYSIQDNSLDVYIACQGTAGGTVTCEVIINNKKAGEVVSQVENRYYEHKSFTINN